MTREQLETVYLDWVNNFVSLDGYAEYYGLYKDEAETLIYLARSVTERNHPES